MPASAWTQHLAAYRASHPSKTMKECMIEASACYRKLGSTSGSTSAKKTSEKRATSKASTTYAAPSSNPWIAHVEAYRASHGCSYGEAMQGAKKTYRGRHEAGCRDYELRTHKAGNRMVIYTAVAKFNAEKESAVMLGGFTNWRLRTFTLYQASMEPLQGDINIVEYVLEYAKELNCKGKYILPKENGTWLYAASLRQGDLFGDNDDVYLGNVKIRRNGFKWLWPARTSDP